MNMTLSVAKGEVPMVVMRNKVAVARDEELVVYVEATTTSSSSLIARPAKIARR